MGHSQVNNKQVAKNAMYLYIRMFITMGITLYTSRFLLLVLGVEDYGVYSVVGGVAVLFTFISTSLLLSSERFIASSIATGDKLEINKVFSTCINSHLLIAAVLLIGSETLGLWLLNTQLVIPEGRMVAANWVFQASVLSCIVSVINSPFHASVIAYEKFDFNAVEGISLTLLRLLILFLVYYSGFDKLIYYALLYALISIAQLTLNGGYCKYKFKELRYIRYFDKCRFLSIFSFAGWNMMKHGAFLCFTQGANLGFNIFGGIVVSAAYGVANQVYGASLSFMHNVQSAFYPQIIKSCAAQEYDALYLLTRRAAKFSFFMMAFIGFPLLLNMDFILRIWLGNVPAYAGQLSRVVVLFCLMEALVEPLNTALMANGKLKRYIPSISGVWIGSALLFIAMLWMGADYWMALSVRLLSTAVIIWISIFLLQKYIGFPLWTFVRKECKSVLIIGFLAYLIPEAARHLYNLSNWQDLMTNSIICWMVLMVSVYTIGLSSSERSAMKAFVKSKIHMS